MEIFIKKHCLMTMIPQVDNCKLSEKQNPNVFSCYQF